MKQRQIFIILGAVGIIFLTCFFSVLATAVKNLWEPNKSKETVVVDLTLCDEDASNLCVVTFGADNQNQMVIHFQLPKEHYAAFYVKATNRGTTNKYPCEVSQAAPTTIYCTGVRTPLGETIDIEVYTIDNDTLIAHGTFLISAIAVVTPISQPTIATTEEETPTEFPSVTEEVTPTQSESTPTPTQSDLTPTPSQTESTPTLTQDESTPTPTPTEPTPTTVSN
jgi:hypothetical protein